MGTLEAIGASMTKGQTPETKKLTQDAIDEGISAEKILNEGLLTAMSALGERFKNKEVYLPEVLIAARAMLAAMEILEPQLASSGVQPKGKVILGTVKGDIHNIGKNLVGIMLKGAGFEVIDLGIDVPPEKFVEAAQSGAPIIGMSALTSTTMPALKTSIDALHAAGFKDTVKTLIGGAIVSQAYADKIGADGYAPDAVSAVDKVKELLGLS